ncbi:hypothetical protein HYH02_005265 [Chlamydomonas schloesseri]|uniref:GYF domain-containing protein n=1 Tax=Chlamydomonas schloesseri TaxID=2026947 RepID=A0A836B7T2_9CHLO|nr:hypothetical protein HYH02_005265 [Chlamydomonas schloesseri]|eukprot:KAG2449739.1 hypothetical protein HYH02_005265 [Chlamydomonas schloesseri]
MAPSSQAVCGDKGRLLELEGGSLAAQAAVVYAILVHLTPQDQLDTITDQSAKCWSYISPGGQRQGPFEARKLLAWHSKGQLPGSFHVQHVPSRVWLPLSILARHHALLERAAGGMHADGPGATDVEYGPVHWPVVMDTDVLMSDAEVAAEIAQLRHADRFLGALDDAVTMEVDSSGAGGGADSAVLSLLLRETRPLSLPAPMDVDVDLFATSATAAPRLYLVLDTNVLLRRDGLALLHTLRQRFAAATDGPEAAAGAEAAAAGTAARISCVAVVPWTVLAELDGLKSAPIRAHLGAAAATAGGGAEEEDEEEERPVAVAARSALSLLRSALEAGDRFFRGQSLAQFRAAASHPAAAIPPGAARITPDDRILQCALHLQDGLLAKSELSGRPYCVALLSNDNALCVKAQVCRVAAASIQQLRVSIRTSSAGGGGSSGAASVAGAQTGGTDEDVSHLQAALLALAEGRQLPATAAALAGEAAAGSGSAGGASSARASQTGVASASTASVVPDAATAAPFSVRISDSGAGVIICGADAAAGTAAAAADETAAAAPTPSGGVDGELVGPYDEMPAVEDPLLHVLRSELYRLTRALAPVVRDIMVAEYEELWTGVLVKPPPWSGADLLEVLQRHMESVFAGRLGRGMARQAAPALDAMLKDFWFFERGRGRPRRELKHLERAEAFVQQVDEMLAAFGVVQPPPATPIPPALLALRPGGGTRHQGPGPAWMGSAGPGAAGMMGPGTGRSMAAPPPPPPQQAGLQPSLSGGLGGQGVNGMGLGGTGLSLVSGPGLGGGMAGGGMGGAAAFPGMGSGAPAAVHSGGPGGRGPGHTISPAAARAAAVAQSIGLSVNLPGASSGASGPSAARSPAGAAAGAATVAGGAEAVRGVMGATAQVQHILQQQQTLQQMHQQQQGLQGGGIDMKAVLMAAQAAGAGAAGGASDPALAQLLQVLVQQQQQQQQLQQGGAGGARPAGPARSNSETSRSTTSALGGAAGAAGADAALAQQMLLAQQQQQQLLLQQQQTQKQQLLQRFHSVPQPAEPGALPSSAQAEAAAMQLQMLQLQVAQQQQQQAQQQQQQQAQQQQQLAVLQQAILAQAQAQAQSQQQKQQQQALQQLSRASSTTSGAGGEGAGSAQPGLSPAASLSLGHSGSGLGGLAGSSGAVGGAPSAALQALLLESQQRQQAQLQLQLLLQQQQAHQQAPAQRAEGATAGGASALTAGLTPELMALLQQQRQQGQQQHHHHYQQQQQQLLQQQHRAFGAVPGAGLGDEDEDDHGAGDPRLRASLVAAAAAAAADRLAGKRSSTDAMCTD